MWRCKTRSVSRASFLSASAHPSGQPPKARAPTWVFTAPPPRVWSVRTPRQAALSSSFLPPNFIYGLTRCHELPSSSRLPMGMVLIWICHCCSYQLCPKATSVHNSISTAVVKRGDPLSGECSPSSLGFATWSPTLSPQSLSVLVQEISLCRCFPRGANFYSVLSPPDQDRKDTCSFFSPFILY